MRWMQRRNHGKNAARLSLLPPAAASRICRTAIVLGVALLVGCAPNYTTVKPPPEFLSLDDKVIGIEAAHRKDAAEARIRLDRTDPPLDRTGQLQVMQFHPQGLIPLGFQRDGDVLTVRLRRGATALIFPTPAGLVRDNYAVLCRLRALPPRLLPVFEERLCPVILCASRARPATTLLERVPELGQLPGGAGLEGLRVGGIGPGFGPGGACERCLNRPPPVFTPECVGPPPGASGCSVEIADEDGTVLSSVVTSEQVAVRTELQALASPAGFTGTTFSWTVEGERIKDYDHDIDEPARHNPEPAAAGDLIGRAISFFWTEDNAGVDVSVDVAMPTGATCSDTETFAVGRSGDINFDVYTVDGDEDRTPGYDVLGGHGSWHFGMPVDGETPPFSDPEGYWGDRDMFSRPNVYNGSAFLEWHRTFIDAHVAWRNTFNAGGFVGPPRPPGAPFKPQYLERTPAPISPEPSRVYNYVRLGEYQDLDQLGRDVVDPWHNTGHEEIAMAGFVRMRDIADSPGTQQDSFWKWHSLVDEPRSDWLAGGGADRADVVSTVPAAGATVSAAPEEIVIGFGRRVSVNAPDENTVQIGADKLTVNGEPATTIADAGTTTRYMVYSFSGYPAPEAGTVNVELEGTAGYSGTSFTFTLSP